MIAGAVCFDVTIVCLVLLKYFLLVWKVTSVVIQKLNGIHGVTMKLPK
jgi:hypothetical protein